MLNGFCLGMKWILPFVCEFCLFESRKSGKKFKNGLQEAELYQLHELNERVICLKIWYAINSHKIYKLFLSDGVYIVCKMTFDIMVNGDQSQF